MLDKKTTLRLALKLMSLMGLGFLAYILLAGLIGDDVSEQVSVVIDITDLKSGEVKYYSIERGKLLVLKRTSEMIADLTENQLMDTYGFKAEQNLPVTMHPVFRSVGEDVFVAYSFDPFYRCDIEFNETYFKSTCIDVTYNLAGRVYKGRHAQGNLIVPVYQIDLDGKLRLF